MNTARSPWTDEAFLRHMHVVPDILPHEQEVMSPLTRCEKWYLVLCFAADVAVFCCFGFVALWFMGAL